MEWCGQVCACAAGGQAGNMPLCGATLRRVLRPTITARLPVRRPPGLTQASGFDAVAGDTLAGTRLPPSSYHQMTQMLLGACVA